MIEQLLVIPYMVAKAFQSHSLGKKNNVLPFKPKGSTIVWKATLR